MKTFLLLLISCLLISCSSEHSAEISGPVSTENIIYSSYDTLKVLAVQRCSSSHSYELFKQIDVLFETEIFVSEKATWDSGVEPSSLFWCEEGKSCLFGVTTSGRREFLGRIDLIGT